MPGDGRMGNKRTICVSAFALARSPARSVSGVCEPTRPDGTVTSETSRRDRSMIAGEVPA